jgi:hypothetical protein
MYGMTRGTATLIGVAVAGFLLWLATQVGADTNADYWGQIGLIAAAGLTMALSQLLGGWTKWGWPRLTPGVFLLGFLPALVIGGLVVLAAQPDQDAFGAGWLADLGLEDMADDLTAVVLPIAFGLGLTFGLTFDTTGPRVRAAEESDGYERGYGRPVSAEVADEPTTAERRVLAKHDDAQDADRDGVDDRDELEEPASDGRSRRLLRR